MEVSCRTAKGRFVFEPRPELQELIWGVIGRGQRHFRIGIHAVVFMSNHYHMLLSVRDVLQLSRFMAFVNGNLARVINRHLGESDPLWARRYSMSLVSSEPAAQRERLSYLLRQGVKEGLVKNPLDWKGPTSWKATLEGRYLQGKWEDRTRRCRDGKKGVNATEDPSYVSWETVELTPLPIWDGLSLEQQRREFRELLDSVRREEVEGKSEEHEPLEVTSAGEKGKALRSVAPPPRRGGCPLVHAASRTVRKLYREAYRTFYAAYRRAADALRDGVDGVPFPEGCFPPALPFCPAAVAPT